MKKNHQYQKSGMRVRSAGTVGSKCLVANLDSLLCSMDIGEIKGGSGMSDGFRDTHTEHAILELK
jgi:hypothetical protein